MINQVGHEPLPSEKAIETLKIKCLDMIARLDEYWNTNRHVISEIYDYAWFSGPWDGSVPNPEPENGFRNSFAASIIAHFDGAKIILNGLLSLVSPNQSDQEFYKRQMMIHSASVLAATRYQDRIGALTGGTLLMVFSLKVVIRASPSKPQRAEATAALLKWGSERGIGGISSPLINGHNLASRQLYPEQLVDIPTSLITY